MYAKGERGADGRLFYDFDHTVEVRRCSATNASNRQRCRNEAGEGTDLCKTHVRASHARDV